MERTLLATDEESFPLDHHWSSYMETVRVISGPQGVPSVNITGVPARSVF